MCHGLSHGVVLAYIAHFQNHAQPSIGGVITGAEASAPPGSTDTVLLLTVPPSSVTTPSSAGISPPSMPSMGTFSSIFSPPPSGYTSPPLALGSKVASS